MEHQGINIGLYFNLRQDSLDSVNEKSAHLDEGSEPALASARPRGGSGHVRGATQDLGDHRSDTARLTASAASTRQVRAAQGRPPPLSGPGATEPADAPLSDQPRP